MKQTNSLKLWILFAIVVTSFIATPALAQKKSSAGSEDAGYETGIIHRIADAEIVINDVLYTFSKDIKFLSRQGAKIETRWFKKGDKVRFITNSRNEIRVVRKT